MERKTRELWLVGIALTVMAALFVWPATRWLVRLQLVSQIVPQGRDHANAERRVSEENPNDFQVQYVHALTFPAPAPNAAREDTASNLPSVMLTPSSVKVERLRGLEARFPNQAALYAHILRYATAGDVILHRQDQDELSSVPVHHDAALPRHATPQALAAFDRDAEQGERLDPGNAYFPLMRAAELYEAGRDADAIAAIHRAGQKTRFEDYTSDEIVSLDRYTTLSQGESGAIARISQAASILFPHYAQLRALCRMGVVSAVHAEQSGDKEAGLSIRLDLAQTGAMMRAQGHSLICSLVGIAITSITTQRPGGIPAPIDNGRLTDAQRKQRVQEREDKYCAYLRGMGRDDAAQWMRREMDAGKQAKDIVNKAQSQDAGAFSMIAMRDLCLWWAANLLTLTNAIGLLILGAFAALAAHVSPGKRLLWWRGAFTCLVVVVFGLWLWNVERSITSWVSGPFQLTASLNSGGADDGSGTSYGGVEAAARIVAIVCALALPLGMLAVIGLVSLCTRVPLATGIGRGLRGLALPVACALFLLYAVQTAGTLRQEARLNTSLQANLHCEGQAMAAALGRYWPGLTR